MEAKNPAKSPVKATKIKVMVIGLTGEKFAFELARKRFDVMIVKNIFDAFREKHGSIVYKRDAEGVYRPISINIADLHLNNIKELASNRAELRFLQRKASKTR